MGEPGPTVDGSSICTPTASPPTESTPPRTWRERARAAGVAVWALCDHDTVAGLPDAAARPPRLGLRFVPGIELSAFLDDEEIHVLGHFIDPAHPALSRVRGHARRAPARAHAAASSSGSPALGVRCGSEDIERLQRREDHRPPPRRPGHGRGGARVDGEGGVRPVPRGGAAGLRGRFRLEARTPWRWCAAPAGRPRIAHPGVVEARRARARAAARRRGGRRRGAPPRPRPGQAREVPAARGGASTWSRRRARTTTGRPSRRTATSATSRWRAAISARLEARRP